MGEIAEPTLLKKGAEASLFITKWHDRDVVIKKRLPKKYRPPKLDLAIRTYRTVHEPQLMSEAKKAGVPTPLIFQVDVKNATIIMELIEGIQVKRVLRDFSPERRRTLCSRIGELIGKLHQTGIIHGDLTTSNMILTDASKVFFVDFGLGEKNVELEAKGVDLHLFKRALQSTHFQFAEECFSAATKGYVAVLGESEAKDVLEKVKEIERRGRYVAERRESEFSA